MNSLIFAPIPVCCHVHLVHKHKNLAPQCWLRRNIRYDVLCELGSKDLKGVQDVQRHILERLRELKNRKRGVSAHLYCKQVSDDRDYDLGCRRLHAFVNDQSLKRRLLDCSIAKRYVSE